MLEIEIEKKINYDIKIEALFTLIKVEALSELRVSKIIDHDYFEAKKIKSLYDNLQRLHNMPIKENLIEILDEIEDVSNIVRKMFYIGVKVRMLLGFLKTYDKKEIETDSDINLCDFNKVEYERISTIIKMKELPELSDWIVIDGFCSTKIIKGTDPSIPKNRIAFIEKSPRVKIGKPSEDSDDESYKWHYGRKYSGGANGHIPENELYGFNKEARKWCDEILKNIGYKI